MNTSVTPVPLSLVLIDDEKGVLLALKLVLNAMGHSVKDFDNPLPAVEYLRTGAPDLVLCDLRMPDMDGLEVLSEIRQIHPALPFVLISGHATDEDIEKATKLGASGFLGKPFSPDELAPILALVKHA